MAEKRVRLTEQSAALEAAYQTLRNLRQSSSAGHHQSGHDMDVDDLFD